MNEKVDLNNTFSYKIYSFGIEVIFSNHIATQLKSITHFIVLLGQARNQHFVKEGEGGEFEHRGKFLCLKSVSIGQCTEQIGENHTYHILGCGREATSRWTIL